MPDVLVGVQVGYGDVAEAKALVDRVSSYTNFLVIGSSAITNNLTKLNETCQYAYDKGLSFISLAPNLRRANRTGWLEYAQRTWGERLMGFYAYDEPAGRQLDLNETRIQTPPSSYVDAANQFVNNMSSQLNYFKDYLNSTHYKLFTSDYALYWYDYKAGYDIVFAEFGWNYSRQLNAALCRGAAIVQNKEWGVIITWTYTAPPYIESGAELYKDLILAYDNGAKYIVVFNANEGWTQGILQEEHLQALRQFWLYIHNNPRRNTSVSKRVAFVLPNGYGYGFRGPNDKIWGLWEADELSHKISVSLGNLLEEYGTKLDIIHDDELLAGNTYGYNKLIYWNDPTLSQPSQPTTPPPTSQTPQPTQTQNPALTPIESQYSIMDYVPAIAAATAIAMVAAPVLIVRKRQYYVTFDVTGVGRDFTGTVVVIDGKGYDRYGAAFWWTSGSRHTFEFKSPLGVSRNKQYVWNSTTGQASHQQGILTISASSTVTGNYRPVFKIGAAALTMMDQRLRPPTKAS
ncbi:MAG: hypothetical protein QXD70_05235 [Candidatus Bathyarchaeia archaeon]